jgi:hypothetical protein
MMMKIKLLVVGFASVPHLAPMLVLCLLMVSLKPYVEWY